MPSFGYGCSNVALALPVARVSRNLIADTNCVLLGRESRERERERGGKNRKSRRRSPRSENFDATKRRFVVYLSTGSGEIQLSRRARLNRSRSLAPTSRVSTVNALNFRIIKRTLFAELRNAVPREIELEAARCVCNRAYPLGHREPVCAATCTFRHIIVQATDETRRDKTRQNLRESEDVWKALPSFPFLSSNYPSTFLHRLPHVPP